MMTSDQVQQIITKKHDPTMNKIAKVVGAPGIPYSYIQHPNYSSPCQEDGEMATFAAGCFWGVQLAFQV